MNDPVPSANFHSKDRRYVSVRADNGKAISNENPSFVAGEVGGGGSGKPKFSSDWGADLVSEPIPNCVTTGGSHARRGPTAFLPSLIGPMADLQTIRSQSDLYGIVSTMARLRIGKGAFRWFTLEGGRRLPLFFGAII